MKGRLLVTGAGGFVGRHAVLAAQAAGFEVHSTGRSRPTDMPPEERWHSTDLLAGSAPERLVEEIRPTHILHAAWETTHGSYWTSPANVLWMSATARLAHAFAAAGGGRFVFVGSCAEYDWQHGVMIEGVTPTKPHTLYGSCKLAAHDLLQALGAQGGIRAVNGRIFFAYGPHENRQRFVPYISRTLGAKQDVLLSSGRQIRDFLHIKDVARALVVLLESDVTGAVNIGMGEPMRLSEIAHFIGEASGEPERLRLGARPDRSDDVPILVPDTRRLTALGWKPETALAKGLYETYAWWKSHNNA